MKGYNDKKKRFFVESWKYSNKNVRYNMKNKIMKGYNDKKKRFFVESWKYSNKNVRYNMKNKIKLSKFCQPLKEIT